APLSRRRARARLNFPTLEGSRYSRSGRESRSNWTLSFSSEKLPEQTAQSAGDAPERPGPNRRPSRLAREIAICVQRESDSGRERRAVHVIREPADASGTSAADRQVENLLCHLRHAVEDRAAAGEHDARVEAFLVPCATD